jgi:hypothetical protein
MSDVWSDFIESLDMSGIIPDGFFPPPSAERSEPPVGGDWSGFTPDEYEDFITDDFESFITDNTPTSWDDISEVEPQDYEDAIKSSIFFVKYMIEFGDKHEDGLSVLLDETKTKMRDEISLAVKGLLLKSKRLDVDKFDDIITMAMLMSLEIMQTLSRIDDDEDE